MTLHVSGERGLMKEKGVNVQKEGSKKQASALRIKGGKFGGPEGQDKFE